MVCGEVNQLFAFCRHRGAVIDSNDLNFSQLKLDS